MRATGVKFECVTCHGEHTAPRDGALALLKLCKGCAAERFAKGRREQRKTKPPAAEKLGEQRQ